MARSWDIDKLVDDDLHGFDLSFVSGETGHASANGVVIDGQQDRQDNVGVFTDLDGSAEGVFLSGASSQSSLVSVEVQSFVGHLDLGSSDVIVDGGGAIGDGHGHGTDDILVGSDQGIGEGAFHGQIDGGHASPFGAANQFTGGGAESGSGVGVAHHGVGDNLGFSNVAANGAGEFLQAVSSSGGLSNGDPNEVVASGGNLHVLFFFAANGAEAINLTIFGAGSVLASGDLPTMTESFNNNLFFFCVAPGAFASAGSNHIGGAGSGIAISPSRPIMAQSGDNAILGNLFAGNADQAAGAGFFAVSGGNNGANAGNIAGVALEVSGISELMANDGDFFNDFMAAADLASVLADTGFVTGGFLHNNPGAIGVAMIQNGGSFGLDFSADAAFIGDLASLFAGSRNLIGHEPVVFSSGHLDGLGSSQRAPSSGAQGAASLAFEISFGAVLAADSLYFLMFDPFLVAGSVGQVELEGFVAVSAGVVGVAAFGAGGSNHSTLHIGVSSGIQGLVHVLNIAAARAGIDIIASLVTGVVNMFALHVVMAQGILVIPTGSFGVFNAANLADIVGIAALGAGGSQNGGLPSMASIILLRANNNSAADRAGGGGVGTFGAGGGGHNVNPLVAGIVVFSALHFQAADLADRQSVTALGASSGNGAVYEVMVTQGAFGDLHLAALGAGFGGGSLGLAIGFYCLSNNIAVGFLSLDFFSEDLVARGADSLGFPNVIVIAFVELFPANPSFAAIHELVIGMGAFGHGARASTHEEHSQQSHEYEFPLFHFVFLRFCHLYRRTSALISDDRVMIS